MYFGDVVQESNIDLSTTVTENESTHTIDPNIKIFNSDQVSLTKINNQNYFGNIDQVLTSPVKYPIAI